MNVETISLILGAGLGASMLPWKKWLGKAPTTPGDQKSLTQKVIDLRFFCACQPKEARDRGLEACDTLDSLVRQQKMLPSPDTDRLSAGGYE